VCGIDIKGKLQFPYDRPEYVIDARSLPPIGSK